MGLIVQKFGGSSVANAERIRNVARIITDTYKEGNDVVVVLSAQGDTTDELIEKAAELNPRASKREMDMRLAPGEAMLLLDEICYNRLCHPVMRSLSYYTNFFDFSILRKLL